VRRRERSAGGSSAGGAGGCRLPLATPGGGTSPLCPGCPLCAAPLGTRHRARRIHVA
jgi:hypothetical protein